EGDHVGVVQLDVNDVVTPQRISPRTVPHATRQWLNRINRTRPPERQLEQVARAVQLVFPLNLPIRKVGIVGLVPYVPAQNALIGAELSHHRFDIVEQGAAVIEIIEAFGARALYPA